MSSSGAPTDGRLRRAGSRIGPRFVPIGSMPRSTGTGVDGTAMGSGATRRTTDAPPAGRRPARRIAALHRCRPAGNDAANAVAAVRAAPRLARARRPAWAASSAATRSLTEARSRGRSVHVVDVAGGASAPFAPLRSGFRPLRAWRAPRGDVGLGPRACGGVRLVAFAHRHQPVGNQPAVGRRHVLESARVRSADHGLAERHRLSGGQAETFGAVQRYVCVARVYESGVDVAGNDAVANDDVGATARGRATVRVRAGW